MADPQRAKPSSNASSNESARRSPSGADLVLLLLLIMVGFGVWAVMERVVAEALRGREPNAQRIMDARGVTKQQADLADLQSEAAEVQKYLNAARLEQVKQHATVESFVATYPQLSTASPAGGTATDTAKAYQEAKRQEQLANGVVVALETRLAGLKHGVETSTSELNNKKEVADRELRRANLVYAGTRKGVSFLATFAIVIVLLWLVWIVLWRLAKKRMSTAEGFQPFLFALAALAVLFAYDQFGFAGAAFVGVLLLLWLLRRTHWPRKSELKLLK
jgi:hypothetical protein